MLNLCKPSIGFAGQAQYKLYANQQKAGKRNPQSCLHKVRRRRDENTTW